MFDMVSRRGFVSLSAVAAAALGLAGCSGNKTSEPAGSDAGSAKTSFKKAVGLQVFAANSLEKALPEVQKLYTEQTGTTFADTQFKASGDLVEQMRAGAAVDVLITASKGTMDDAEAAELVDADTREDMFVNDLVIIRAEAPTPRSRPSPTSRTWTARLPSATLRPFPPASMPTKRWLLLGSTPVPRATTGEYAPELADKVALADKVGTAAAYVSTGDCVAGFVYSSDIFRYDGIEEAFVCPEDSHKPIVYPGAVAESSEHADEAKAFIDFCLTNKKAQKIWAKYGFELSA